MPRRRLPGRTVALLAVLALVCLAALDLLRPNPLLQDLWQPPRGEPGVERMLEDYRERGPIRPIPMPPR